KFKNYYNIDTKDIIVIHDDLDLPLGKIRIREKGSCGGQNGMRNIIDLLHTSEIKRIRVGISHDRQYDTKDYVLGRFDEESMKVFNEVKDKASDALIYSFDNTFINVMNRFN
ncbi:MAG: aminoacyl-tRNA hydrolase, partial [Erysipelotrichaceae bacterium]